jgi:hypothetical protein
LNLLTRIYSHSQLQQVSRDLDALLKGLKVEAEILGTNPQGWVQVSVSGEDQKVAERYLADTFGFCPVNLEKVSKYETVKGYVTDLGKSTNELWVDIGVWSPCRVNASIPLHRLQAQLGDGRKIALQKMVDIFGFCNNLPLHVKISSTDLQRRRFEAELPEKQRKQYADWTRSLLDRLIVLGASLGEVKSAIRMAESNRDIAKIEQLGMFEQVIVCKLGTDAAGLIPKIGRNLKRMALSIFSPRRILELLGNDSALLTS